MSLGSNGVKKCDTVTVDRQLTEIDCEAFRAKWLSRNKCTDKEVGGGVGSSFVSRLVNSLLTVTGKFSLMIGTLLCVFGLRERHSELESRDIRPFETSTNGRHSSSGRVDSAEFTSSRKRLFVGCVTYQQCACVSQDGSAQTVVRTATLR